MSITMTLRMDEETNSRLTDLAKATDRSKAYLANQAVSQYLRDNEWQVAAITEAALAAESAAEDQFVAHEEVMQWLGSWGTRDEKTPPLS
ncbi:MAG TPA: CopG family transcriptional regulator [Oceanospirillaceae bacterium]|nr:CopG family transcriptional regulator [Oceanospirillaceae bacterium]